MVTSTFDPSQHPSLSEAQAILVRQVSDFTREFFRNPKYDSSHDFNHVMRVVSNAVHILDAERRSQQQQQQTLTVTTTTEPIVNGTRPNLDAFTVILGALLHDVDDKKYIEIVDASNGMYVPLAKQELLRLGMSEDDAQRIQTLVEGVSYSSEAKDPERTRAVLCQIPELAVVQDADRLDAIGAIGIARCFTYGGAKSARTLQHSVDHFVDKLLKLKGMMKTKTGRAMAAERTRRLEVYLSWWADETGVDSHDRP